MIKVEIKIINWKRRRRLDFQLTEIKKLFG